MTDPVTGQQDARTILAELLRLKELHDHDSLGYTAEGDAKERAWSEARRFLDAERVLPRQGEPDEAEGFRIEVVPACEIDAGERVILDRFGEIERVLQIEFRTPEEGWRRVRTDHRARRKVGMPLMDDTPVMRVLAVDTRDTVSSDGE